MSDWFATPPMMAVKKLGRNICAAKKALGYRDAAIIAVLEVHNRLPEFIDVWEIHNGEPWKGDEWFAGRISRYSQDQANKVSHMRVENIVRNLTYDNSTYTWERWERLVYGGVEEAAPTYYVYLLPFKDGSGEYVVQKPGISTRPYQRHKQYKYDFRKQKIDVEPAERFAIICPLHGASESRALAIEKKCMAVVGNGQPPRKGDEWFETGLLAAMSSVSGVLQAEGYIPVFDKGIRVSI